MTDFVALSRAARDYPGPESHDRLWSTWFALPTWHFIKVPSPSGWLPYSSFIGGHRCVLAFSEAVRADGYARFASLMIAGVQSAVLTLTPGSMMQMVPQLRMWGVAGMIVDTGPDGFYSALDQLFNMYRRYHAGGNAQSSAQRLPATTMPRTGGVGGLSMDSMLALPVWHVITTKDDPGFPELAFRDTDLVAQIYSSAQAVARHVGEPRPPVAVMTPKDALTLLSDIELVALVRFDNQLEVQFIDLKLRAG